MASRSSLDDRFADPYAVRDAVARMDASPAATAEVDVRETHISWLFLTREHAYKLKKPLVLEFLDYGTPERRRAMCREEVRLNARLAPDLYLGVRAIVESADGLQIAGPDAAGAIDYLVQMRRYDEDQNLAATIARGEAAPSDAEHLGRALARFHDACPLVAGAGGASAARSEVEQNLGELIVQTGPAPERVQVEALGGFMRAFANAHSARLDARAAQGRVRDCHADLRAEHVVLRPALKIVDCVEFDAGLRTLDVADDLAFLVMDLARLEAQPLASALVAAYRDQGGDCGDDALLSFFGVHRALVRVKVQYVRAAQHPLHSEAWETTSAEGLSLLAVAERLAWRARGPLVLVICGLPASGKSHLAAALSALAGLPVLSSDVVRKQLAGLDPRQRAPTDVYRAEFSRRTYAELGRRAAPPFDAGEIVVVDGTFRHRADRRAFEQTVGRRSPTVFVECQAPPGVLAQRAADRERDPSRVSDATVEVVQRERDTWASLDEVPAQAHLQLRTDRAVEQR